MGDTRTIVLVAMYNLIGEEAALAKSNDDFDRYRDIVDLVIALEHLYPTEMKKLRRENVQG